MPDRYTRDETRAISDAFRSGGCASCPRCATELDARPVPGRGDVAYVRRRSRLTCSACGRTLVVDLREGG